MSSPTDNLHDRGRVHRILLAVLTALLIAFTAWCVVLLWRAQELRRDLDQQLEWVDDVRRLRGELDRLPAIPMQGENCREFPWRCRSLRDR